MEEQEQAVPIIPGAESSYIIPSERSLPKEEQRIFFFGALGFRDRIRLASFSREFNRIIRQANEKLGLEVAKDEKTAKKNLERLSQLGDATDEEDEQLRKDVETIVEDGTASIAFSPDFIEAALGTPGNPRALIGWANWTEGQDIVEFDPDTFLDELHPGDMLTLAMEAYRRNLLGRTARKKLR